MSVENISLFHSVLDEALERLGKKNLNLKESQYEAVKAVAVDLKDTICILPTGYGKSLIYQLLLFVFDTYLGYENTSSSITVISPLNALMVDQIKKAKSTHGCHCVESKRGKQLMMSAVGSIYEQIVEGNIGRVSIPQYRTKITKIPHKIN